MVRSLEDIVLGTFAGDLVCPDILNGYCGSTGRLVEVALCVGTKINSADASSELSTA